MSIQSPDQSKPNHVEIVGPDGEIIEVDAKLLRAQITEANGYYGEIDKQKDLLKDLIETIAEQTGLTKGFVSKYLKARYDTKTEEASLAGKAFQALDEATE